MVARGILAEAAHQLAGIALAVRRQLFPAGQAVLMSYVGGVFRSAAILTSFQRLIETNPANSVKPPVYGPAAGALLEAYRIAGIRCVLEQVPEEKSREY